MVTRVIDKALAGSPDLLWGIGVQSQERDGITYDIPRVDKIHPINTMAELIALSVADENNLFTKIHLLGFTLRGDGGGGFFYYDSTVAHSSQNGKTIVQATGSSVTGCWIRIEDKKAIQTDFLDLGADINTTNKFEGKQVWDSTNKQPVWARGETPGDLWVDGTGATTHTPV